MTGHATPACSAAHGARHGPALGPAAFGPLGTSGLTVSRLRFGGYREPVPARARGAARGVPATSRRAEPGGEPRGHRRGGPHLPAERRAETLSRKALWTLASTPGITTVLVGMRRAEYVDDALGVLRWPPLPAPRPVHEAARRLALAG